jgi:hypothetical protein
MTEPVTETPDELQTHLNELERLYRERPDAKDAISKHQLVAGIAGGIGDRRFREKEEASNREAAERAIEAEQARLLQLAEDDPEAFAEKFRSEKAAERARKELETLQTKARETVGTHIGRAVRDLPEWKDLTAAEVGRIQRATSGLPEEQVLGVYVKTVADIVADRRAEQKMDQRVAKEKEAWEQEQAASRVRNGASPNLRRGAPGGADEPDFRSDYKGWIKWDEERRKQRR